MSSGARIEVRPGERGPVVVKIASDAAARERLAREALRLDQARHPGVVELLEAGEDQLVLAWAGDRTLELVRPDVATAAALLAAVASTVADLHELGIVHGRIGPDHVIVGADGRPRLCSFAGGATTATSAGDVADVGRLIDLLLGDGLEPEPIPDRRWARRRTPGPDRRSLLAVADRASQEDPAQRPTARSLALLITDAVPSARLPRPTSPVLPPAVGPPPMIEAGPDPVADHGSDGSESDHPRAARPLDHAGDGSHEEVAEVVDQPDDVVGPEAPPRDQADRSGSVATDPALFPDWLLDHPLPDALRHTWDAERLRPTTVGERPGPLHSEPRLAGSRTGEGDPPGFLGLRIEPDDAPGPSAPTDVRERPPHRRDVPVVARRGRQLGPSARAAAIAVAATVLVIGLAVASGWLRLGPATTSTTATTGLPASPADPPAPPDRRPRVAQGSTPGCRPTQGAAIDVDGDRCPEHYRIEGTTIRVAGEAWSIGQAGDQVALGDWDCDGLATPGVVRPATGEVFLFPRWPDRGEALTVEPSMVRAGAIGLTTSTAGTPCSRPSVRLRDGRREAVPVGQAPP
ncbi:MAG: serine/threonine protein kinase [Acidimicrobiales bacterium]|nr:serine/threonine protein kinase [Acidimicrobiales bacterium]